jgi:hypothetical protein
VVDACGALFPWLFDLGRLSRFVNVHVHPLRPCYPDLRHQLACSSNPYYEMNEPFIAEYNLCSTVAGDATNCSFSTAVDERADEALSEYQFESPLNSLPYSAYGQCMGAEVKRRRRLDAWVSLLFGLNNTCITSFPFSFFALDFRRAPKLWALAHRALWPSRHVQRAVTMFLEHLNLTRYLSWHLRLTDFPAWCSRNSNFTGCFATETAVVQFFVPHIQRQCAQVPSCTVLLATDEPSHALVALGLQALDQLGIRTLLLDDQALLDAFVNTLPDPAAVRHGQRTSYSVVDDFALIDRVNAATLGEDGMLINIRGIALTQPHACVLPVLVQEVLAHGDVFIGSSGSTFALAVHDIRAYRLGRSFNSTILQDKVTHVTSK